MKRLVGFVCVLNLVVALSSQRAEAQSLYDNTFALSEVELLDGPFKHAMDLNVKVLLQYDADRLLAPFFKEAGLPMKAQPFPNWEGLDGHVAGHYVGALAIHYAATGSQECYDRLLYVLKELKQCQDANGDGYLGGVPNSKVLWANLSKGDLRMYKSAWVPWYNVHKMYAGLRDAYQYAGVEMARDMFLDFCDWGVKVIADLTPDQIENMVGTEFGGMNEVFADAYYMTGEAKYLDAAKKFSHHDIYDSMLHGIDNLDNKHANTQVPKAAGYARLAEVTNDADYKLAAEFFWDRVANHRSVVIGGNSRSEHFPTDSDYISYIENREGPESCNTHNMLKLTEFLFAMDQKAEYADFYEKAMYNHILSTQHPIHGGYVYFTPMRPGHYRVYSAVNQGMWCCVGTGMENHGKYGEFIYTHDGDNVLSVNLFVASRLNWAEKGVTLTQTTDFPYAESSRIVVSAKKARKWTLKVRCPSWTTDGFSIKVNGEEFAAGADLCSYVSISRKWKDGDAIDISLPMKVQVEELDNKPEYLAVKKGPIVLAARTGTDDLAGLVADDGRWSHIAHGHLVPIAETPVMIGSREQIEAKVQAMKPVPGKPLHYTVKGLFDESRFPDIELEPFFSLHDSRYAIYFLSLTGNDYGRMLERLRADEQAMLVLDARTVDAITPGEQQPEADHRVASENSTTGYQDNDAYRTVRRDGSFSYDLYPDGHDDLSLCIGYWGNESAQGQGPAGMARSLEISLDGEVLVSETDFPATGESSVARKEYAVPAGMISGKQKVRITFKAGETGFAPRVFDVRFLAPEKQ